MNDYELDAIGAIKLTSDYEEGICKLNLQRAVQELGVALVAARMAGYGHEPIIGIEAAMRETQAVLNILS